MINDNNTAETSQRYVCWRKSHYSNPCGSCIELAHLPDERIVIRDSKHHHGPVLIFPRSGIIAFIHAMKMGEFDRTLRRIA